MKEWIEKAKLFQNMTLKMASLAGAIIIWLIIMNINDPVVTRIIYDVPVKVWDCPTRFLMVTTRLP